MVDNRVVSLISALRDSIRERDNLKKFRCVAKDHFSAATVRQNFIDFMTKKKGLTYAEAVLLIKQAWKNLDGLRDSFYDSVEQNLSWAFDATPRLGGRYNTPDFGTFYTAKEIDTAIKERQYHYNKAASLPGKKPMKFVVYSVYFNGKLADVRLFDDIREFMEDGDDYSHCQYVASELKTGCDGLAARSVRAPGGNCCAIFVRETLQPIELEHDQEGTFQPDGTISR